MLWLNHPKFRKVREDALVAMNREEYRFRRLKKVIFLCGGRQSNRRERLRKYLLREKKVLVFYAEDVWEAIVKIQELSALELEATLAGFADLVIIIVESVGTFAELGAFSLSDKLRKKLLPVVEAQYQQEQSFLNTGPINWVDRDSIFAPSIWANLDTILESAGEIDSRIDRIPTAETRVTDLSSSPKHLLFFTCDLVSIFGPCPVEHVTFYLERLLGKNPESLVLYLELACAMGLLKAWRSGETVLYRRPLDEGNLLPFHYTKKHLGIPQLRAEVISVMQSIDTSRAALISTRSE
jgi:hypothetical protein